MKELVPIVFVLVVCPAVLFVCPLDAQDFTVTRFAGHDGGPANVDAASGAARLNRPHGIAVDPVSGNIYVAERDSHTIRRITPAGAVSTFAGLAGVEGYVEGRGGVARFSEPCGITVDISGNVYVADIGNNAVRKISPAGVVSTLGHMSLPFGVATDSAGNVYVTDIIYSIYRFTPAGEGSTFVYSPWQEPTFYGPAGIAVDPAGNVYFTESSSVRRVTPAGVMTTVASVSTPSGIAIDRNGDLYVASYGNNRIYKITAGTLTTFAGSGVEGSADGIGTAASFSYPEELSIQPDGTLLVADSLNHAIRKITIPGAVVSTFTGRAVQSGTMDGITDVARFTGPSDTVVDSQGNLFVADNWTIRRITPTGDVTTFAGSPVASGSADGTGANARFLDVNGLAIDSSDNLYVTDTENHTIRKITPAGAVTTLAGMAGFRGSADGTGPAARFEWPSHLAIHPSGDLYVADYVNHTLRKVTPAGVVTTFAGSAGDAGTTDGTGTNARFSYPTGIAIDDAGTIYLANSGSTIRRITTPGGEVTTFAGTAGAYGSDDGTGAAARFFSPNDMAIDGGDLYLVDGFHQIRRITPAAVVTTVAGAPHRSAMMDGTGNIARLWYPAGIGSDGAGQFYITGSGGRIISHMRRPGIDDIATTSSTVPGVNTVVQLDTAPDSATSWRWSVLRRPAGSAVELSATNIRNPTFTPDVADLFVLLLRAEGLGGVRFSTVEITPAGCDPLASVVASVPSPMVCINSTGATASVAVSGGGTLGYQWGWRSTTGGAITSIGDATSASYVLNGADFGSVGTKYLVVTVTPSCGPALVSNQIPITVTAPHTANVTASSGVFANGAHNFASVPSAGAGATYVWSITNGTINSGQGTRTIDYAAGASGDVILGVQVDANGCAASGGATVPIIARAAGAVMLYTVTPCRVFDTRVTGPALASNTIQTVAVAGVCGIPSSAKAVVINMTVVSPAGFGWLTVFPADAALPGTSSLNYATGKTRANNAVVPLSSLGQLKVYNHNSTTSATHFIIDAAGYFE